MESPLTGYVSTVRCAGSVCASGVGEPKKIKPLQGSPQGEHTAACSLTVGGGDDRAAVQQALQGQTRQWDGEAIGQDLIFQPILQTAGGC